MCALVLPHLAGQPRTPAALVLLLQDGYLNCTAPHTCGMPSLSHPVAGTGLDTGRPDGKAALPWQAGDMMITYSLQGGATLTLRASGGLWGRVATWYLQGGRLVQSARVDTFRWLLLNNRSRGVIAKQSWLGRT